MVRVAHSGVPHRSRPPALTPEEDSVDLPDELDIDESLPADLWFRHLEPEAITKDHLVHV